MKSEHLSPKGGAEAGEGTDINLVEDAELAERTAYIEKPYRDQFRGGNEVIGVGVGRAAIFDKMSEVTRKLGLEKVGLTYDDLSEKKKNELYREAAQLARKESLDGAAAHYSETYIQAVSTLPKSKKEKEGKLESLKEDVEEGVRKVMTALKDAYPKLDINDRIVKLSQPEFQSAINHLSGELRRIHPMYGDTVRRFNDLIDALSDYKRSGDVLESGELVMEESGPYIAVEEKIKEARAQAGL